MSLFFFCQRISICKKIRAGDAGGECFIFDKASKSEKIRAGEGCWGTGRGGGKLIILTN